MNTERTELKEPGNCPSCGESGDAGSLCENKPWHHPRTGAWAVFGRGQNAIQEEPE